MIILKNPDGQTVGALVGQINAVVLPLAELTGETIENVSTFDYMNVSFTVKGTCRDIGRLIQTHNEGNDVIMVEEDDL